ncbi:hypothetical protein HNR07_000056 [Nocardiopsis metallicus]|uniref:Uncharacterized protein n=1 Tax=Nocardiopsis metallicus TaxID=179819 RepID=A0A840VX34_9ACTN|nr:hypothetical protein [Nocardiopsis metallicus]
MNLSTPRRAMDFFSGVAYHGRDLGPEPRPSTAVPDLQA